MIKCSQCGIESEIEQAFKKQRHWFGLQTKMYCPTCQRRRVTRSLLVTLVCFLAGGAFGFGFVVVDPTNWYGWLLLRLFAFFIATIPLLVIHESAHAIVGHLTGFRIFSVLVGYGQTLFRRRLRGTNWEVKALPFGGLTVMSSPQQHGYRLRNFLSVLAGPASHALLLLPLFMLKESDVAQRNDIIWELSSALFAVNVIYLIANLIPFKTTSVMGEVGSDGWQLLKIPFLSASELEERLASYYAQESLDAYRLHDIATAKWWAAEGLKRYPNNPHALIGFGFVEVQLGEFARARESFTLALQSPANVKPALKFMALNNIAYVDLSLRDPLLLPEADDYSLAAYKNAPWQPEIVGTRGAVLVELGQIAEGIALLKKAMAAQDDVRGKAADACHIAIAEKRRGNLVESQRYLDAASALDPECVLIPRVMSEAVADELR